MASFRETVSVLCIDSLFSTIIILHILILLYFPSLFSHLVFSPLLVFTTVLVFSILRFWKTQFSVSEENECDSAEIINCSSTLSDDTKVEHELNNSFLEWDVRAPLEVIYEEHEGEAADENRVFEEIRMSKMNEIQKYASLSLFYPESDSNDSLDGNSPRTCDWTSRENAFSWSEEEDYDDIEGLIEIALDDRKICSEIEEDNLIEIDL